MRRSAPLAVCSAREDRGTALVYAVSARRSRDRTFACAADERGDASASASTCPCLGHAGAASARVRLVADGDHDRYRRVVPIFCSRHAARTLSVAVSALLPLKLSPSRSTRRFVNNCPNLSAHTTTWVQCMSWLVDWARSRCSRSTIVTDRRADAPTRARHISPEQAARGHPTPFSWVFYVTDTTSTSFGARRQLSARSTFRRRAWGTGTWGVGGDLAENARAVRNKLPEGSETACV